MKALKQFFVLASVFICAELVIAFLIIRNYETQRAQLETQKNGGGEVSDQTDSGDLKLNTLQLTAK